MVLVIATLSLSVLASGISVYDGAIDQPLTTREVGVPSQTVTEPSWFTIEGLVYNRLNLTYADLQELPMVSETAELHCVGAGNGANGPSVTYNWTGVPLFYLLNMARVIPGTYRKVVFNATDGFSDSLFLDEAMDPTTLMGLKANGTDLRQVSGFGSDYRLVLPGRWGYKWVKLIKQIVIVDYNYNGTYEGYGLSGLAKRPNVAMPQTNPPTTSYTIVGYENSPPIKVLTNSSVQSFERQGDRLTFRVTGSEGTSGYFYVVISRQVLDEPYDILVDGQSISHVVTTTDGFVYLWVTYSHSSHTIEIEGSLVVSSGSCQSRSVMM